MRTQRLYPRVIVEAQSFKDVKQVAVPNQSMTLKEILQRFVRKESLPVMQDGFYAENLGDLEKIAREDITVRHERGAELKDKIASARKKQESDKKTAEEKAAGGSGEPLKGATPPVQTPTNTPPPGQHPGSHTN